MYLRHAKFVPNPTNDRDPCLSVFLCAPVHVMRGYSSVSHEISPEEWELGFQDGSAIPQDKIKEVLKVSVYACSDMYEALRQMENWRNLLAGLFGGGSVAARTMDEIIMCVEKSSATLAGKAFRDPNLMPGLLQYIHNTYVAYFRECSYCSPSGIPPGIDISLVTQKLRVQDDFSHVPLDPLVISALGHARNKHGHKQPRDNEDRSPNKPGKKTRDAKQKSSPDKEAKGWKSDPAHPGFNKWYDKKLQTDSKPNSPNSSAQQPRSQSSMPPRTRRA